MHPRAQELLNTPASALGEPGTDVLIPQPRPHLPTPPPDGKPQPGPIPAVLERAGEGKHVWAMLLSSRDQEGTEKKGGEGAERRKGKN